MNISNSTLDKRRIKNKITLCSRDDHNNIKEIFKKYNHKKYTKNKNGYFINLDCVPNNILQEIEEYIDLKNKNREDKLKKKLEISSNDYETYSINNNENDIQNESSFDLDKENIDKGYNLNQEDNSSKKNIECDGLYIDNEIDNEIDNDIGNDIENEIGNEIDNDQIDDVDNLSDINDENDDKSIMFDKYSYPSVINNLIKKCRDIQKKCINDSDILYSVYTDYEYDDNNDDELTEDNNYSLI